MQILNFALFLLRLFSGLPVQIDIRLHTAFRCQSTEIYAKTNSKIKEEQLKEHSASVETAQKYSKKQKEDLIDWLKKNL